MSDSLTKCGVFIDDLNKIRVFDPKMHIKTSELQNKCEVFTEKIGDFQKLTDEFVSLLESQAMNVDKEKLKAIGKKNLYQSLSKKNECEQLLLQAMFAEKSVDLERLKTEYLSLQKVIAEQQDSLYQIQN